MRFSQLRAVADIAGRVRSAMGAERLCASWASKVARVGVFWPYILPLSTFR